MAASPPTLVRVVYQAALGCQLGKAKAIFSLHHVNGWMDAHALSSGGKEGKGKELQARVKNASEFSLPDWIPVAPWEAFVEMRKKSRKALTEKAKLLAT